MAGRFDGRERIQLSKARSSSFVSKTSGMTSQVLLPAAHAGIGADFSAFGIAPAVKVPVKGSFGIPRAEDQPRTWFNVFKQKDLEDLFRIWHWVY